MQFLGVPDIARILGVSERQAERLIKAGKCGDFSQIGPLRVRTEEFERAWKAQETKVRNGRP